MTDQEDRQVKRIRRGEGDALAEFIERHQSRLLAFIRRNLSERLAGKVEPQDILQETALGALAAIGHTGLDGRDPYRWLCQLAEQRIIDAHRRYFAAQKRSAEREVPLEAPNARASQSPGLIQLLVASMTAPSQIASRDRKLTAVNQALDELPEEQRTGLRLRYLEGRSSREIAHRFGKSDGAVRVMLSRALARLQKRLEI